MLAVRFSHFLKERHSDAQIQTSFSLAFHLVTATKKGFSTKEIQRQLGHKRYQPVWCMVHKIRACMGARDDEYTLCGTLELDEGFFSVEVPEDKKDEPKKRGRLRRLFWLWLKVSLIMKNPIRGKVEKRVI